MHVNMNGFRNLFVKNIIDRPEMRFKMLKDGPFSLAIGRG